MLWLHLIGRVLFAFVFLMSGVAHFMQKDQMVGFAKARGVPAAGIAVPLTGAVIIAAALMLVIGFHPQTAGWLLFVFLLGTSFLMHPFWEETDPGQQQMEMIQFMKDMALAGAALLVVYYGGGDWPLRVVD